MKRLWQVFGAAALGALNSVNDAQPVDRPSALIMIWDRYPDCVVRQNSREPGHEIPCKEAAGYLLDTLHLHPGDLVEIDLGGKAAPDAVAATSSDLSRKGFGITQGFRVGFISDPGIEKRAVAVITVSEKSSACTVLRNLQDPTREIPCQQVGSYLLNDLKIPCGAFVSTTFEGHLNMDAYRALFSGMSERDFESAGSGGVLRRCDRDR